MGTIVKVYRLEFLQPDGRWTGPYCAEYMTARAFGLRDNMLAAHRGSPRHPFPDAQIFAANPGKDRYVCASVSMRELLAWFGGYLRLFIAEGGHIGIYEVPLGAVANHDAYQIVYQQRQGRLVSRKGRVILPTTALMERIHPSKKKK